MDYREIYQTLYEDQMEGAEEEYLAWFEGAFLPADVEWGDREAACDALRHLLCELYEERSDFEELMDNAGLSERDLAILGF